MHGCTPHLTQQFCYLSHICNTAICTLNDSKFTIESFLKTTHEAQIFNDILE